MEAKSTSDWTTTRELIPVLTVVWSSRSGAAVEASGSLELRVQLGVHLH